MEGAILGGCGNTTGTAANTGNCSGQVAPQANTISGGNHNRAQDIDTSITGGCNNLTGAGTVPTSGCEPSSQAILGGEGNNAIGDESSITGGLTNSTTDTGLLSTVLGGKNHVTIDSCQTIPATNNC